jgi:hypothetical protein
LLESVKVASDESLVLSTEIVASAMGCLAAVSINFPLMLPSAFWACAAVKRAHIKMDKVKIFFIISVVCEIVYESRRNKVFQPSPKV